MIKFILIYASSFKCSKTIHIQSAKRNSVNLKDEKIYSIFYDQFLWTFDKTARKAMKTAQATFWKEKLIRKQFKIIIFPPHTLWIIKIELILETMFRAIGRMFCSHWSSWIYVKSRFAWVIFVRQILPQAKKEDHATLLQSYKACTSNRRYHSYGLLERWALRFFWR